MIEEELAASVGVALTAAAWLALKLGSRKQQHEANTMSSSSAGSDGEHVRLVDRLSTLHRDVNGRLQEDANYVNKLQQSRSPQQKMSLGGDHFAQSARLEKIYHQHLNALVEHANAFEAEVISLREQLAQERVAATSLTRGLAQSLLVYAPVLTAATIVGLRLYALHLQQKRRNEEDYECKSPATACDTPTSPRPQLFPVSPRETGETTHTQQYCAGCHRNARDALLLPCQHLAVCVACSEILMAESHPQCPLCLRSVTSVQHPASAA